jgi:hypothetical protein
MTTIKIAELTALISIMHASFLYSIMHAPFFIEGTHKFLPFGYEFQGSTYGYLQVIIVRDWRPVMSCKHLNEMNWVFTSAHNIAWGLSEDS